MTFAASGPNDYKCVRDALILQHNSATYILQRHPVLNSAIKTFLDSVQDGQIAIFLNFVRTEYGVGYDTWSQLLDCSVRESASLDQLRCASSSIAVNAWGDGTKPEHFPPRRL